MSLRFTRGILDHVDLQPQGFNVVGLVRAARRRADCSQRELAQRAGLAASTIGRIEAGSLVPSIATLRRLLAVAHLELVVVDQEYRVIRPMGDREDMRDGAERRYPSHLDLILDPDSGDWWGGRYGLARPPETFHRKRWWRDVQRRRSQWEVRVKQNRHLPPPPTVREWRQRNPGSTENDGGIPSEL